MNNFFKNLQNDNGLKVSIVIIGIILFMIVVAVLDESENSNEFDFNDVKTNDLNEFIDSSDYFSSLGENVSQAPLNNDVPGINSNDYFSDLSVSNSSNNLSNDNLDNTIVVQNGAFNKFSVNEPIKVENTEPVTSVDVSVQEPVSVSVQEPVNNLPVQETVNVVTPELVNNSEVLNNNYRVENPSVISNESSNDPLSLSNTLNNSNVSYIDQVKDRMNTGYSKTGVSEVLPTTESVGESFGFSGSGITSGNEVISDNSELPELEKISSEPVLDNVEPEKKSHLGIIIFMILLVLALGALSFYLYNYVF